MKKTLKIVFVGVDVSKDAFDIFDPGTRSKECRIENEESAVEEFCKKLAKRESSIMLVMEATGGYETRLVRAAARHGLAQAVVNPRQVRDFAHGIGMDAKTDQIDARVISRFGEVVGPAPMAMASDHSQQHSALVTRRSQLIGRKCTVTLGCCGLPSISLKAKSTRGSIRMDIARSPRKLPF